jgi:hypothetical protein
MSKIVIVIPIIVRENAYDQNVGNVLSDTVALAVSQQFSELRKKKQTPWSESANELYRPSDRLLSVK